MCSAHDEVLALARARGTTCRTAATSVTAVPSGCRAGHSTHCAIFVADGVIVKDARSDGKAVFEGVQLIHTNLGEVAVLKEQHAVPGLFAFRSAGGFLGRDTVHRMASTVGDSTWRLIQRDCLNVHLLDVFNDPNQQTGLRAQRQTMGEQLRVERGHVCELGLVHVQHRKEDLSVLTVHDCGPITRCEDTQRAGVLKHTKSDAVRAQHTIALVGEAWQVRGEVHSVSNEPAISETHQQVRFAAQGHQQDVARLGVGAQLHAADLLQGGQGMQTHGIVCPHRHGHDGAAGWCCGGGVITYRLQVHRLRQLLTRGAERAQRHTRNVLVKLHRGHQGNALSSLVNLQIVQFAAGQCEGELRQGARGHRDGARRRVLGQQNKGLAVDQTHRARGHLHQGATLHVGTVQRGLLAGKAINFHLSHFFVFDRQYSGLAQKGLHEVFIKRIALVCAQ
mmetsp:Transcript_24359/g.41963  ORF Transcript_24359/g.41963 Transcript_24359/m.41963 type:complete len:449 (-) Transcript_24359:1262-2608(-)